MSIVYDTCGACPKGLCDGCHLCINSDPLTIVPADEEPWSVPLEVAARPRQRWALILAVAGVGAIVLLLGGTRV